MRIVTSPANESDFKASRTEGRLMWNALQSSASDGSLSPGFQRPPRSCRRSARRPVRLALSRASGVTTSIGIMFTLIRSVIARPIFIVVKNGTGAAVFFDKLSGCPAA